MEKNMENEMETLGPLKGYIRIKRHVTPRRETEMEKNMEHEMDTGGI